MAQQFDAILVGAGQAAPALAGRLASRKMKLAFVERHRFGGTCVNTGCIPSKAWVASAETAFEVSRSAEMGIRVDAPFRTDMARVKSRKDEIIGRSSQGVEEGIRRLPNCTVFHGTAQFEAPLTLRVGDEILTAPSIFLNLGGRAVVPDVPGVQQVPFLTNSSILDLDTLPRHLVILGGGYIALEFGQMFRRFGSQVTILQRGPTLIPKEDPDIRDAVTAILRDSGVRVELDVDVSEFRLSGNDIEAVWPKASVSGSHLLLAVGRRPNTGDLRAERGGLSLDQHGYIRVNDRLEAAPGVWALGDCNGRGAFTHTSYNDFEIVADNVLDGADRKVTDRITAYNIYIDPPLGRVGMTETEARESGRPILKATRPMTTVNRAIVRGETAGFMKAIADAETKQLLGAAFLGTQCDEAVQLLLPMMYGRLPYPVLTHSVLIHPTVSELVATLLEDLQPL